MSQLPRAPERRRNGKPDDAPPWLHPTSEPPPEPRWLHLVGPLAITSALLIALGVWKLAELLARAL